MRKEAHHREIHPKNSFPYESNLSWFSRGPKQPPENVSLLSLEATPRRLAFLYLTSHSLQARTHFDPTARKCKTYAWKRREPLAFFHKTPSVKFHVRRGGGEVHLNKMRRADSFAASLHVFHNLHRAQPGAENEQ